mmetsp:Transcript_42310/g.67782  ORF Transcript_42310/g.67782 Transcript_42310/m.67782 type:complete len:294 (-) Transcript_42310:21-902(-)
MSRPNSKNKSFLENKTPLILLLVSFINNSTLVKMKVFVFASVAAAFVGSANADASTLRDALNSKLRGPSTSATCQAIYAQDMADSFSRCTNETEVEGQIKDQKVDCTQLTTYDTCAREPACWWWHLKHKNNPHCMANPCFRINNGQCTIQHTGGRCVWYTAEQNFALRGINNPGCYKTPCGNPKVNTRKGCREAGNDFYKCTWCNKYRGQSYGCMNAELTSSAQCWNIGGAGSHYGCTGCMNKELTTTGDNCKKSTCKKNCCQSPLCECIPEAGRDPGDVGVNIFNGDGQTSR